MEEEKVVGILCHGSLALSIPSTHTIFFFFKVKTCNWLKKKVNSG